jgi:2-dehydro-3-deoxy-D-arabinonate dehydratase
MSCLPPAAAIVYCRSMKVFRTRAGVVAEDAGKSVLLATTWDDLFRAADPVALVREELARGRAAALDEAALLAPIVSQEVWAAGVTYFKSRDARMEESRDAAGGDFYARVYEAERPELFFKSSPHRVVGHGGACACAPTRAGTCPSPSSRWP